MNTLTENHKTELMQGSVINENRIQARGYQSITNPADLPDAFADYQRRPGLLIPLRTVNGKVESWQLKPDTPRTGGNGNPLKYESAARSRQVLDVPVSVHPLLKNPLLPLWITEGAKKVDSALCHGVGCVIGMQGVYGWRGSNEHGGKVAIADWESIALNGRQVVLAFDSDVMTKKEVRGALERLATFLSSKGARVEYLVMPHLEDGSKCGLDDWFASGNTFADLPQHLHKNLDATVPPPPPDTVPTADVVGLNEVEAKEIDWLWSNWLPKGMLTLLGGYAGDGKSTLTMSLAATFSNGGTLPDGSTAPVVNTLLLAAEDDPAHVVKPRLQVHGANMERIGFLRGIKEGDSLRQFNLRRDIPALKQRVIEQKIGLIVIDPLSSYLASSDRNSEGDVRDTLNPLVQLMEETGAAVIGIMHIGKTDGQAKAMQRLMGSTAFTALARSVWMVADLPSEYQDETAPVKKMLGVSKSNYAVAPKPLVFSRPQDGAIGFQGASPISIEDVFTWKKSTERERTPKEVDRAEEWLLELMDGKRVLSGDIERAAQDEGLAFATVKRAKLRLGISSDRDGQQWYWLPPVDDQLRTA